MSSPAEFARKLERVARAVKEQDRRAILARGLVVKQYIVEAAAARTRQARPSWVSLKLTDNDTARLRLRGGMAHLTQLGSHDHPGGWPEVPKHSTARRRRNAAKKGIELVEHSALNTPWGPKASVQHPALKPRPFWEQGLAKGREPGTRAYARSVHGTITAALR